MPRCLTRSELYAQRGQDEILRLAGGSETAVDEAITAAEAEAVSYIIGRYRQTLPTLPGATPPVLKAKVAVLAHRRLSRQPSPSLETEAKDAITWLRDVAAGRASLDLAEAPPVDNTSPSALISSPTGPGMRREDLEDW
jgi:phage gp36-like protein